MRSSEIYNSRKFSLSQVDPLVFAKNAAKLILVLAALGIVLPLAVAVPNLPRALAGLGEVLEEMTRKRKKQALRRLEKQRLVEIHETAKGLRIELTEHGKKYISEFSIEHMRLREGQPWDKKWRIVIFDIPEEFRKGRIALHSKLKQLGLYPMQKSVFVYPYPCKEEIDFIADFFGIERYISHIEAIHIDDDAFLRHEFDV